jgi:hypothetical protein
MQAMPIVEKIATVPVKNKPKSNTLTITSYYSYNCESLLHLSTTRITTVGVFTILITASENLIILYLSHSSIIVRLISHCLLSGINCLVRDNNYDTIFTP